MLSCVGLKAGLLPFKEVHLKQRNVGSQQIGILHREELDGLYRSSNVSGAVKYTRQE